MPLAPMVQWLTLWTLNPEDLSSYLGGTGSLKKRTGQSSFSTQTMKPSINGINRLPVHASAVVGHVSLHLQ